MSDLTVALILRAVDRLSGPLKRAGRAVGLLSREAQRSGRRMRAAGDGTRAFARAQQQARRAAEQTTRAVQRQAQALKRLARMREEAARKLRDRGLAAAGKLAAGGAAASAGAWTVKRMVEGAVTPLREVEKAKGELATLEPKNIDVWVNAAKKAQGQIAGIMAADFLRAAYDIKSALSHLSDEAGASMTLAAAWTAKATKSTAADMTNLFTAVYGAFKDQFPKVSDARFGDMIAGITAAAVQQFKTSGSKINQALQSASGAPAKVGISMAEQFAVLGMLQQTMEAGMAGTALKQFAAKAAEAQQRFNKLGVKVRLLDEKGMVRDVADIMSELRAAFGDVLDAKEMATIQKAFGTEEAVRLIAALWGQEGALRAYVRAMRDAASAGRQVAITMAMRGMANLDDRLVLLAQKWDLLKQQIGEAFQPVLERLIPVVATMIDTISALMKQYPRLSTGIATVVVGFGALLAVAGPLMMALSTLVGTLTMAAFAFRLFRAAKLRGMAAEILEVGAAMDRVGRKKWRLPRLIWRAAIAPLRWAAFIPRLAWRVFVAPLRWAAGLIPRIPWAALAGRLSWRTLVQPLTWAGGLLRRIPWASLAGKLNWGMLIRPLAWGARFIPYIGWAVLAGQLAWDLLIKPLGWAKYISLDGLRAAWGQVRAFFAGIDWMSIIRGINWPLIALTGLPGVVAEIVRSFTSIDLTAAGARIMHSLWNGLKSVAAGLLAWAQELSAKLKGAFSGAWAWTKKMAGKAGSAVGAALGMSGGKAAQPQERASGGGFNPGPLLVGERGPELIYAHRRGWVASNDNLRRLAVRAAAARRQLMQTAAAAAVAAPLVSLPPALLAQAPAISAAAAPVPAAPVPARTAPNMTVHITINVQGQADARDIAAEVDKALRRAARSALHDLEDGGAA